MLNTLFAAASAALIHPLNLIQSQAPAQPPAAMQASCEDAAIRVNSNVLPRSGSAQWNDWVTLTGCGARGATVLAGALRSEGVRTETELSRLDYMAGLLDGWFQPQLVAAYEGILRSPDASNAMRLRAMWLLSGLYAPSIDVAGPLQGYMSARCETYDRNTSLREAPERLPESAYEEARSAVAFAADDRTAPEYVRTTARCWERVIADELKQGTVVEERAPQTVLVNDNRTVYVERPLRVVYECDNRFVIYNDAGYDLAMRYDGYGSRGVLRVTRGGPYVWVAARFGPVRFWVGDTEVYYSSAAYRPCHSYRSRVIVVGDVRPWSGWHVGLGVWIRPPVYHTVRYIIPRHHVRRPVIHVTRPIIVGPNRRGNDDWDRGRNERDRYDGRRDDDRGRDGNRNNDNRTYGTRTDGGRNDNDNDGRGRNERDNNNGGRSGRTNDGNGNNGGVTFGYRNDGGRDLGGRSGGTRTEGTRTDGPRDNGPERNTGPYRAAERRAVVDAPKTFRVPAAPEAPRQATPQPRAAEPRGGRAEAPRRGDDGDKGSTSSDRGARGRDKRGG
jgi:hypothetical protein